ncbi:MAG: MerR family DNA-binding transcriptional regulator [Romboutsia timonensis]|uniref:MerR family DNA-binding transcriptional regulator n=1 Tax=Romboutsia timonensis TaxID=1776391 RepID=UPI0039953533
MKSKLLTIGELSKRTGCSIKALRYYDLIGLLKPVYVDPNSNYRYYNFEQTRMVELIQICINLSIPLKEVKDLVFKDNNKIDYIQLIEYGKKITEEKISSLNNSLSFLNFLQEDIERINSYSDYESKEFNFDEKYYYTIPLFEDEMNDNFYKLLDDMFNECFSKNLYIKHDYGVIINIKDDVVTKFVACEVYKIDSNIENIIKVKEGTFLCKKTSSFNFDDICDMFSDVGCNDKTIIISPGYNYDFSSPYFEVKCTV